MQYMPNGECRITERRENKHAERRGMGHLNPFLVILQEKDFPHQVEEVGIHQVRLQKVNNQAGRK